MEENYRKAFKEVYVIMDNASKEEINKIPKRFIEFIEENMEIGYEPQIEFNENFEKSILEETLLILALIYRDYIISKEERVFLIQQEEIQLKENYNIDNVFIKRKQNIEKNNINNIEQQLIVVKKEKWYKKILNKIIKVFNKKR